MPTVIVCVSLCWGRTSIQLPDPKDAAEWGWLSEDAALKTGLPQCGLWCRCLAVITLPDQGICLYLVLEGHAFYSFWPKVSWEGGFPCSAFSVPVQPTSKAPVSQKAPSQDWNLPAQNHNIATFLPSLRNPPRGSGKFSFLKEVIIHLLFPEQSNRLALLPERRACALLDNPCGVYLS